MTISYLYTSEQLNLINTCTYIPRCRQHGSPSLYLCRAHTPLRNHDDHQAAVTGPLAVGRGEQQTAAHNAPLAYTERTNW